MTTMPLTMTTATSGTMLISTGTNTVTWTNVIQQPPASEVLEYEEEVTQYDKAGNVLDKTTQKCIKKLGPKG